MYRAIISLVFIISLLKCHDCQQQLSRIKLKGNLFADQYGRIKLFHGFNAVNKAYPWYPDNLQNKTQLDNLKIWGFNSVRLGVMWSGLRPERDVVNTTYLNIILEIIDELQKRGLYVIIDLHQDMLSSKFAAYDGAPRWLIDSMPNSTFEYPWPFKKYYLGFTAYLTEACGSAFQNLYSNVNKFQDYFAEFWGIVAQSMSNLTSVLGYEYINEPWAGDIYSNPGLLLPGQAGRKNLLPLYDNVYKTIRKYDNDTLVFYEPVTWGILFNGTSWGTGFDRAPANDPNRTVLSWHYYCWLLQFNSNPLKNDTYPLLDRIVCDEIQRDFAFETVKFDRKIIGGGSFLTEFGVCAFPTKNDTLITTECEYVLDSADDYFQSWAYWDSNFYTYHGEINYPIIHIFSRVYPQSTAGTPLALYYNTTTAIFIYEYEHDTAISEPTEIFIPQHIYPNGFQVSVSDHLVYKFDSDNRLLLVTLSDDYDNDDPLDAKIMIMSVSYTENFNF